MPGNLRVTDNVTQVVHSPLGVRMPAKNPRINVALERPIHSLIEKLAQERGLSMSLVTRGLVREALEIHEDAVLARVAEERAGTLAARSALGHEDVWEQE